MKRLVYLTIYISLFIQLITGILSFSGLFIKINKEDFALKEICKIFNMFLCQRHIGSFNQ